MRAAVLPDYQADLLIEDVPVPDPGPGEVLVRVAGAGLGHQELRLARGEAHTVPHFPWILGHEVSGWVEALGPGAHGFEHGEPVLVFGGWGCGACPVCLAGEEQLCSRTLWAGVGRPGGFAQYIVVPAARHLEPLGDLDPTTSAPLAGAALTPYRAVRHALPRLRPGARVVLLGAGARGQYAVQLLRALTPAEVVVVEASEARRKLALGLGAHHALDPADPALGELTRSAAAVIDLVATDETLALAGGLAGVQATIVVVGDAGGSLRLSALAEAPEAHLVASCWGNRSELSDVVALARDGQLDTRVHERDLAAVNTAMHDLAGGEVEGRIVLVP